jgi:glycine/D-amino acid oxidase-like deaminating enzyme
VTPRIRYGISPWAAALPPPSRPGYPRLDGTLDVPVAIVGGGLAGVATAYAFAAAGVRVALVEADRIGGGGTSACAGQVLAEPGGDFLDHEALYGRRAARAMWQATRRASLELQATIRRLKIRCGVTSLDGVIFATGPDQARHLRRELQARKAAGLDAAWLSERSLSSLGIPANGGIRTRGHAELDPLRATLGLAKAAAERGAALFERSAAATIEATRGGIRISTAKGTVNAETVVLATGEPTPAYRALDRHFTKRETYVVMTPALPAAVRGAASDRGAVLQDRADPPHRLFWTSDHRIVWSGADQGRTPERGRDRILVQRTGQLMYELSLLINAISGIQPEFGWQAPYAQAVDGLPFIGPHRNYPRHFFAWGLGANVGAAFLASRILLRHQTGQSDKDDEPFGFARFSR